MVLSENKYNFFIFLHKKKYFIYIKLEIYEYIHCLNRSLDKMIILI